MPREEFKFATEPLSHQLSYFERIRNRNHFSNNWEQGCLDAETEYLSPDGWKKISAYTQGRVAQFDPVTGTADFVQPLRHVVEDCAEFIHFKSERGLDQCLTPDHKVLWMGQPHLKDRQRINTAAEVEEALLSGQRAVRRFPVTFKLEYEGEGTGLTEQELRLQVAVMADGSFPKNCSTSRVVMRLKKERKKERLRELLQRIECNERDCVTAKGFTVFSFEAPLKIKTYPWWDLTSHERSVIVDEVWRWDGSAAKNGRGWTFFSNHESDVDFIQYVAAAEGLSTNKARDSRGSWRMSVRGTRNSPVMAYKENVFRTKSLDGKSYCFQVPSGFLVARRNQWVFLTGNCGKSKCCIDEAAWLYSKGMIDGILVLAPNGVHANWIDDEIPKHLHESVNVTTHTYYSQKAKTIRAKKSLQACLDAKGLAVLVMSYDALMTENGKNAAKAFLTKRVCYYVADEATRIKNPAAQRTKRALASSLYAPFRRVLSGTPVANGPFDVYSPMKFIDQNFWKKNGPFNSFGEFKNCFGVFKDSTNPATGRLFKQCVAYRNLPYLRTLMKNDMERLLKKDVLDLPEKIYQRRYYEMTPKQNKLYQQLESEALAEFDGELVDGTLAIVRMIRQYQVLCGYLPAEDDRGEHLKLIDEKNPRLDCMFDAMPDYAGKKIIWCKWTKDVDLIMERAKKLKIKAVRYDGEVGTFERRQNLHDFRNDPDIELFVTKQSVAGEGLTIIEACTNFYYTNDWPLGPRQQSEDRSHRIGQFNPVTYVDFVCLGTKDIDIVEALQKKIEISNVILGDEEKSWIGNKWLMGQEAQKESPLEDATLMVEDDAEAYEKFFRSST